MFCTHWHANLSACSTSLSEPVTAGLALQPVQVMSRASTSSGASARAFSVESRDWRLASYSTSMACRKRKPGSCCRRCASEAGSSSLQVDIFQNQTVSVALNRIGCCASTAEPQSPEILSAVTHAVLSRILRLRR
ncbi:hypothetical protein AcW1_010395 [Taiwanofungus camphoratus]|nr:hypothetical protein AcW1_010395 [Antrodia cinnamomea]